MIKVTENPELGKFITVTDVMDNDNGEKIVVEVTKWDALPQNITVTFLENSLRPRAARVFAQLHYNGKEYRQKVGLPKWTLKCKTDKENRQGWKIWKSFDNPTRRVNNYLCHYGLKIDTAKKIALEGLQESA